MGQVIICNFDDSVFVDFKCFVKRDGVLFEQFLCDFFVVKVCEEKEVFFEFVKGM